MLRFVSNVVSMPVLRVYVGTAVDLALCGRDVSFFVPLVSEGLRTHIRLQRAAWSFKQLLDLNLRSFCSCSLSTASDK